jgi:hypothetical protein
MRWGRKVGAGLWGPGTYLYASKGPNLATFGKNWLESAESPQLVTVVCDMHAIIHKFTKYDSH